MIFALSGARIFDGTSFHTGKAVVIGGKRIVAMCPENSVDPEFPVVNLAGGLLAPGFIDVQVNGGGGALLNDHPSIAVVRTIANSHRRFGTTGLLPTVITDRPEVTAAAIAAVREARREGIDNVLGIHVEGPFLDPARKGAHDPGLIRSISAADVALLAAADCGEMMLTLAPNKVSPEVIGQLVAAGIHVSLGHSDASHEIVRAALDAGASSFTHLFNAMSQMTGREPGMVGTALADERSYIGIIADGLHVHDLSLRLALKAASANRIMLVTDAMPPAAGGPDTFRLQGREVMRVGGRLQLADGTLAGSNLTMDEALRHAVNRLSVPLEAALRMASFNPACFLKRDDLGRIAPGALASLVHLDDGLHVKQTWVEGQ